MSRRLMGIGASPGHARGSARWVKRDLPPVPHRTIGPREVDREVGRFEEARARAREQIERLRDRAAEQVGAVEAKIFESQILMLDDPELVDGTHSYIRENFLSAERAFDWRLLEIRSQFLDTAHAMVLDRLVDLQDIRHHLLGHLLEGVSEEADPLSGGPAILLFQELTPSFAVRLSPERALGLVAAGGSRTSHSAVLARSLGIPAVFGVGASLQEVTNGTCLLLDGASGRIVVDASEAEVQAHERAVERLAAWRERIGEGGGEPLYTADGERVHLLANLDQPEEAPAAAQVGAEGVGLFRSEFLVVGRRSIPTEEEQYTAYRTVLESFPRREVTLRTFDIGGDKFPIFLPTPPEKNPYLGWRAIRVCLDLPELFLNQLRAAVRAAAHGRLRILVPFVVSVEEIRRTRELLREADRGEERADRIPLGIMVETPAAVETLDLLSPHVEFLSLGTNDLTQYVVAADRGSPRLAGIYEPLHPALLRLYGRVQERAAEAELEVSVCGDLAADPIGLAALLGLGYRSFSVTPTAIPELREIVQVVAAKELGEVCRGLMNRETGEEIRVRLARYLEGAVPFDTAVAARLTSV
ncbi:MAG: phosphoenolpyruvate--protein phosphotransferase [Gemmatimonadota bacterium]